MSKGKGWRGRHQARTAAFKALFALDARRGGDPQAALDHTLEETDVPAAEVPYAQRLVHGVMQAQEDLDALIQASAPSWPVAQLARVDRTILRLAVYELMHEPSVPRSVAIDEAIELAKEYGSDSSPRFVHGVLGTISMGLPSEGESTRESDLPGPTTAR